MRKGRLVLGCGERVLDLAGGKGVNGRVRVAPTTDQVLEELSILFFELQGVGISRRGSVAVRLPYLFADILRVLRLLTMENLSTVVGCYTAYRVWEEVKPDGGVDCED